MSVHSSIATQPPAPTSEPKDHGVESNAASRPHVLTVVVEDYFQAAVFRGLVDERHWDRFESRLELQTHATLDLLDEHGTRATFFVLGWIAERHPELVREIVDRGHEVACRGFDRTPVAEMTPERFRDDLLRARAAIENAGGRRVHGHRAGTGWLRERDAWMLDVVADIGFAYDSSLLPRSIAIGRPNDHRFVHVRETAAGPLHEVPPASVRLLGCDVPVAGGNYVRQWPRTFTRWALRNWRHEAPFVAYFHTWELDPEQPRITAAGPVSRVRHYRNLGRVRAMFAEFLAEHEFAPVADVLELAEERVERTAPPANPPHLVRLVREDDRSIAKVRTSISIVVPCFNEERSIPYLARTLESVRYELSDAYEPEFVFVDDCSTDTTVDVLAATFADDPAVRVVQHETNKGVAAAILTGIEAARHDLVASMDCDCSYDPHELRRMLPLLTDDVDLVTASPYHPEGTVENVPGWRLFLSRGLSALYARVLPVKLHTYTSCFRIHRREAFAGMTLSNGGFLGVAEMLAHVARHGSRIVEYPTTLSVRIFGESKMKTLRCIRGHLGLLTRYAFSKRPPTPSTPNPEAPSPSGRGPG